MNSTLKKASSLAKSDLKISLRRSESLLVTVIVPIFALIASSQTEGGVEKYLPFVLLLTVMGTALLSIGISTGFDRRYRVLVRLGTTPLGKVGIVLSKIIYIFILETILLLIVAGVGVVLGYDLTVKSFLLFPLCWLASITFTSIALIIASNIKAETNLGIQNLVYFLFIVTGSLAFVSKTSSSYLYDLTRLIPSTALHSLLRFTTGLENFSWISLISLLVLGALLSFIAIKVFKFDE